MVVLVHKCVQQTHLLALHLETSGYILRLLNAFFKNGLVFFLIIGDPRGDNLNRRRHIPMYNVTIFDTQSVSPFHCAVVSLVDAAGVSMVGHGVPWPCTKRLIMSRYMLLLVIHKGYSFMQRGMLLNSCSSILCWYSHLSLRSAGNIYKLCANQTSNSGFDQTFMPYWGYSLRAAEQGAG